MAKPNLCVLHENLGGGSIRRQAHIVLEYMAVPAGPLVIGIQSLRSVFCLLFSADDATGPRVDSE